MPPPPCTPVNEVACSHAHFGSGVCVCARVCVCVCACVRVCVGVIVIVNAYSSIYSHVRACVYLLFVHVCE